MKKIASPLVALTVFLSLAGCGSVTETRVTEGSSPIGSSPSGSVIQESNPRIVHVDKLERIATIRNGTQFKEAVFVKTMSAFGQTSVLKIEPVTSETLRTAYILEGEPGINDIVKVVSAVERDQLLKLYPESAF